MAQLIFKLDGQVVPNPINWQSLGYTITRDQNINILFSELKGTMDFWALGFQILWNARVNKCELLPYSVDIDCNGRIYTFVGNVVVSDITYDLDKCIASAELIDDNFQARVNNNKSLEVDFRQRILKDLINFQPEITKRTITLPVGLINFRTDAYFLTDSFQYILNFITDNKVTFQSQFLQRPENRTIMITLGQYIRFFGQVELEGSTITVNQRPLEPPSVVLTFERLFNTITRKLGLVGAFIGNKFILEDYAYFDNQPTVLQFFDQAEIKLSFNQDEIYSAVQLGAEPFLENWECTGGLCNNYQRDYFGFKKEQYWFEGNCNIDRQLELLTTEIIFDTNIIEDIIRFNNESFDTNVLIIKCNAEPNPITGSYSVETANPLQGLTEPYFNAYFRNNEAMNRRFGGYIPSVAATVIQDQIDFDNADGLFRVQSSLGDPVTAIIELDEATFQFKSYFEIFGQYYPFRDEVNNPIGAVDLDTNLWTCPIDGYYTLSANLTINDLGLNIFPCCLDGQSVCALVRYNPIGGYDGIIASDIQNIIWGFLPNVSTENPAGAVFHLVQYTGYFQKGMQVGVEYLAKQEVASIPAARVRVRNFSFIGVRDSFNCTICEKDDNYLTQQPATFDSLKPAILEFERKLSFNDVVSLILQPEQNIEVSSPVLNQQKCQIKSAEVDNFEDFSTKFTLMTKIP
jgi:hypothetical protein